MDYYTKIECDKIENLINKKTTEKEELERDLLQEEIWLNVYKTSGNKDYERIQNCENKIKELNKKISQLDSEINDLIRRKNELEND